MAKVSLRTATVSCLAISVAIWLLFLLMRLSPLDIRNIPGIGMVMLIALVVALVAPVVATGLAGAAVSPIAPSTIKRADIRLRDCRSPWPIIFIPHHTLAVMPQDSIDAGDARIDFWRPEVRWQSIVALKWPFTLPNAPRFDAQKTAQEIKCEVAFVVV
jgi:hypothetical protein